MSNQKRMQNTKLDKRLYRKKPRIIFFALIRTWFWIVATIAIFSILLPIYVFPFYIIIMGTLQYHLNILGHDGLHFSLVSSKKINDFICRFFLHGPQGAPLSMMRSSHLSHHRNLGKDNDKDRQYYGLEQFKDGSAYKRWIAFSFLGGMFLPIILKLNKLQKNALAEKKSGERGLDYLSILVTQTIIFLYCLYLTGSLLSYFYIWILPLFTVMFGLNTLRSNLEHARHVETANQSLLFTFRPTRLASIFISPFNMNYHAEHHIAPAIPFYNLPLVSIAENNSDIIQCDSYSTRFKQIIHGFDRRTSPTEKAQHHV